MCYEKLKCAKHTLITWTHRSWKTNAIISETYLNTCERAANRRRNQRAPAKCLRHFRSCMKKKKYRTSRRRRITESTANFNLQFGKTQKKVRSHWNGNWERRIKQWTLEISTEKRDEQFENIEIATENKEFENTKDRKPRRREIEESTAKCKSRREKYENVRATLHGDWETY